ncbi:NEL-type E3 ubiquitin ligase domain-containing protein [Pseudomonas sp. SDO524_S393]
MVQKHDLLDAASPVTQAEMDAALLEMTGDLDKARAVQATLPHWLLDARPQTLRAIEHTHREGEEARRRAGQWLARLQPLDRFCVERLQAFLRSKGVTGVDVECDRLELPKRSLSGVGADLGGALQSTVTVTTLSLVQAAMQNFSADQAEPGGMSASAVLRSAATGQPIVGMTVRAFVGYCRELDLGCAYQAHIRNVFNLREPSAAMQADGQGFNRAAFDLGESRCIDLQIELHIAYAKGHVSEPTHAALLKVIEADPSADESWNWQSLNIDGVCLWSVVLFSTEPSGQIPAKRVVVYMPNEPQRPWYEYNCLEDFTLYLTLMFKAHSYRKVFGNYLDESERLEFFQRYDKADKVGPVGVIPLQTRLSDLFFKACIGKLQLDAQVLAVPKAQVDADAWQQRLQTYLGIGLNLLNVAGFVVPVLGQLMMGVAIGQLLGEVFEGVEDWSHGDNDEALSHLFDVVENIAGMVLFAAGGRVMGTLKRQLTRPAQFFEKVEPISLADQRPKLWRPRLNPYSQPGQVFQRGWRADARGIYQVNGQAYTNIDGALYAISFDPAIGKWRAMHPRRPDAWRPPLEHNQQGGWQHVYERPRDWLSPLYSLGRIDPALGQIPADQLNSLAAITELEEADIQRLALEHEPLPERFQNALARLRLHHRIGELSYALEHGIQPDASTARLQMLALPFVPGWPQGRFFEVLDEQENLLESLAHSPPFDYEDMSIHITEQQLKDGQVMDVLLQALSREDRAHLLGQNVEMEQARTLLEQRLLTTLNRQHSAVHQRLYADYEGTAQGELVPLAAQYPQLPRRVAWELVSNARTVDRKIMRETARVPLQLARQTRRVLDKLHEDQALMGLYWPQLANTGTRRIALGTLERLSGWPRDVAFQLREGRLTGPALERIGPADARVRRTIVQSAEGFQTFDEQGRDLDALATGPDALYQAIVDGLSPVQRNALRLAGTHSGGRLRSQLRFKCQDERYRVRGYLWPERGMPEAAPSSCIQAQVGPPAADPPALVRRLRKLYPLLSAVEISRVIKGAGHDHLSRALKVQALESDFALLHRVLKTWSNQAPSDVQAVALWDHRLSRHRAMRLIEQCWRRMTVARDERGLRIPVLELDGMLLGGLPTLPPQIQFEHVQKLSLRNMQLGDEVAYFLKHFKGVHTLDLTQNRLTRLPEVLGHMPQLARLRMANNQLLLNEYSLRTLAELRTLRSLNLSENPLIDAPQVGKMLDLRELLLRNCKLTGFPGGCQRLPWLEHVDLRQNEITTLPEWLSGMPRRFAEAINLRLNPLSSTSQLALKNYRRNHGSGMGFLEDDIARLNEQRARELWLCKEGLSDYVEKERVWKGLMDEPGSDGLFKLLAELGNTADARFVREDLERRIWRVLTAASGDEDLREEVFQRAATPLRCDDAAASNFSALEVLTEISDSTRLIEDRVITAKPLLKLAKGLFRLDQLESIARRHSDSNPTVDPLEVSLAYRTGLVDRFHLPGQPLHMRFARLGGVTPSALDSAEAHVRAAELSPEMLSYLVELPFWTDYLKRTFAHRFERLNEPFNQRVNAVFDQGLTLADVDYRDQMSLILQEQKQAQATEIRRLSEEALRIDDLGICSLL